MARYCVVKEKASGCRQNREFTVFHEDFETAKKEAERLTRQEACPFLILRVIGTTRFAEHPIQYDEE